MEHSTHVAPTALAVIGLGCRFPGADGPAEFWHNLLANTDSVTPVPPERFDITPHWAPHSGTLGKTASRHGGFIDDVFAFDHAFFGISPAEAKTVDPQQRLLLHTAWEALEHAGIRPSTLAGTHAGVFVGQATAEYSEVSAYPGGPHIQDMAGSRLRAVTAGRLSFALDLLGPSLVLDTACSSSLVAVHTARQSLLTGECDLAIAAGVNVVLSSHDAIAYSQGAMLSPDGRCRFGDANANGFVRSDGVGVVILKRLTDAQNDGDNILATILGSAVTNDGRGSGLLLQPAVSGQITMLHTAARTAGIAPDQLDYIEAHGTGTAVGDAVELRALAHATARPTDNPLPTGSVKTNIGHAESAAGIAGLIKAILIAQHHTIPASLHCTHPNPVITDEQLNITIVTHNTPLTTTPRDPARIGISSFGISGTNAHIIIGTHRPTHTTKEETPDTTNTTPHTTARETADTGHTTNNNQATTTPEATTHTAAEDTAVGETADAGHTTTTNTPATTDTPTTPAGPPAADTQAAKDTENDEQLLVLSARSARSLALLASAWADYLEGDGNRHRLRDLCAAAALRRDTHPHRLWARGATHTDLAHRLRAIATGNPTAGAAIAHAGYTPRRTAFIFPGQGSQWLGMGRDLLASNPTFRNAITACDQAIHAELGWSLTTLLTEATTLPTDIDKVQPALFAIGTALATTLRAMGLDPDVCLGHSMGEIAAAHTAGALTLHDATAVICRRSHLMRRLAGRGAMLAVELGADEARTLLTSHPDYATACIAADNSPTATILAGPPHTLTTLTHHLEQHGILCRTVRVEVASHSPDMDLIAHDLTTALTDITPQPAHTPLISSLHAKPLTGTELTPQYWQDNLRQSVRFTEAIRHLCNHDTLFLEISPHPVLTTAIDETRRTTTAEGTTLPTLQRHHHEPTTLLETLGHAHTHGATIDWNRHYNTTTPPHIPDLPTYTWDTNHFRRPTQTTTPHTGTSGINPDNNGSTTHHNTPATPAPHTQEAPLTHWGITPTHTPITIRGLRPLPPTTYLAAILHTAHTALGHPHTLTNTHLTNTLLTHHDIPHTHLRITIDPPNPDGTRHAHAHIRRTPTAPLEPCAHTTLHPHPTPTTHNRRTLLDHTLAKRLDYHTTQDFQHLTDTHGITIDPHHQAHQHLWRRNNLAIARLRPTTPHPATTNDATHAAGTLPVTSATDGLTWEAGLLTLLAAYRPTTTYTPTHFGTIHIHQQPHTDYWALARVRPTKRGPAHADVLFLDTNGHTLAEFLNITLQPLPTTPRNPHTTLTRTRTTLTTLTHRLTPTCTLTHHHTTPAPTTTPIPIPIPEQRTTTHPTPTSNDTNTGTGNGTSTPAQTLLHHIAHLLEIPEHHIDHRRPLRDLGLDSLTATRLRTELHTTHGLNLTAGRLLGPEPLHHLLTTLTPQPTP
ncbi:acyltransferase domain-containing protein [Kitasatospora hibisci]|uniref:acyltransferase domain-containing protein n=1 Tax=Kitasatospora hibisci TaxID=3369522 RepID=UPI003754410E